MYVHAPNGQSQSLYFWRGGHLIPEPMSTRWVDLGSSPALWSCFFQAGRSGLPVQLTSVAEVCWGEGWTVEGFGSYQKLKPTSLGFCSEGLLSSQVDLKPRFICQRELGSHSISSRWVDLPCLGYLWSQQVPFPTGTVLGGCTYAPLWIWHKAGLSIMHDV